MALATPPVGAALFLVLTLIVAGCLDPSTSSGPVLEPVRSIVNSSHQLESILPFEARAADGVVLRGHVYLPNGTGPFATILEYSPYWNAGGGRPSDGQVLVKDGIRTMTPNWGPLLEAGFAVALVSVRGSGFSDGCFSYINLPQDGADAAVVIDAIAKQPWSNGAVGMIGISYAGATQMAAVAAGAPPALKAVVPSSGHIDTWNLLGRYGVPIRLAPVHPASRDVLQGIGGQGLPRGYTPTPQHYCKSTLEGEIAYEDLVLTGDKTAWFKARDLRAKLDQQEIPMWATNGLLEGEGHILQFEGLWDVMPAERRLIVGQWPHAFPSGENFTWPTLLIPWFDHYLRGGPKTLATSIVDYQADDGSWHVATEWPPAGRDVTLKLSGRALLEEGGAVQASERSFNSVPADPGPEACETDHATYVSPPLAETVLLAGNFVVNLTLSSTLPDGVISAYLYHEPAQPGCMGSGVTTGNSDNEVRRAISDLRHRGHLETGRDFPVGAKEGVSLRSYPFASVVPAGHRLILSVGGGSTDVVPDPLPARLTVWTGPGVTAELQLRVVEGELRFDD